MITRTTLIENDHALAISRSQGALRSYGLGFAPGQFVLYKNDHGYQPVASTPFQWRHGQSYGLSLRVDGNRLVGSIGGGPELTWWDEETPYLNGQIGLSNFAGCHTRYDAVEIHPG